ncbi:MAG: hypothetical protein V9F03_02235 [Microthrixaceae bacterium]
MSSGAATSTVVVVVVLVVVEVPLGELSAPAPADPVDRVEPSDPSAPMALISPNQDDSAPGAAPQPPPLPDVFCRPMGLAEGVGSVEVIQMPMVPQT